MLLWIRTDRNVFKRLFKLQIDHMGLYMVQNRSLSLRKYLLNTSIELTIQIKLRYHLNKTTISRKFYQNLST